jgi:mannose-6-phosphate isomerase-like protein (cupin superfamily)
MSVRLPSRTPAALGASKGASEMNTIDLDHVQLQENQTAGGPIRVAFPFHSALGTRSTAAVLFELDPGDSLATHVDSAEEVLFVLEGEADASIADERTSLAAGQLAVVPALAPHSVRNAGPDRLCVLGIFSSSTVVATFEEPLDGEGTQVMVIGAPMPVLSPLAEAPV